MVLSVNQQFNYVDSIAKSNEMEELTKSYLKDEQKIKEEGASIAAIGNEKKFGISERKYEYEREKIREFL